MSDNMILSHYSSNVLLTLEPRQFVHDPEYIWKPRGFWVSVDGEYDWLEWCTSEEFRLEGLANRHTIKLKDDAKILLITTDEELCAFIKEYGILPPWAEAQKRVFGRGFNIDFELRQVDEWLARSRDDKNIFGHISLYPDWQRVSEDYQGIIIAPYLWKCRWPFMWYYTWDCASGCIWDTTAIESIEHDPTFVAPEPRKKAEEEEAA